MRQTAGVRQTTGVRRRQPLMRARPSCNMDAARRPSRGAAAAPGCSRMRAGGGRVPPVHCQPAAGSCRRRTRGGAASRCSEVQRVTHVGTYPWPPPGDGGGEQVSTHLTRHPNAVPIPHGRRAGEHQPLLRVRRHPRARRPPPPLRPLLAPGAPPEPATHGPEPATHGPEPATHGPDPATHGPELATHGPEPATDGPEKPGYPRSYRRTPDGAEEL